MNQELELLELELKTMGYKDADDFIRKNKDLLTERQLRLLQTIGFQF